MRNNIPTDDNFAATLPPQEEDASQKITQEQINLAKIGNSPQWKIITDYLEGRIEVYKKGLFGEDLTGKSTDVIGQRFLAAQSVIHEFETLLGEVKRTTDVVNETKKR